MPMANPHGLLVTGNGVMPAELLINTKNQHAITIDTKFRIRKVAESSFKTVIIAILQFLNKTMFYHRMSQ